MQRIPHTLGTEKPAWVDDTMYIITDDYRKTRMAIDIPWREVSSFRIPAGNWAHQALDAGMEPFNGHSQPADWNGGPVLLADGTIWHETPDWDAARHLPRRIIGYTRVETWTPDRRTVLHICDTLRTRIGGSIAMTQSYKMAADFIASRYLQPDPIEAIARDVYTTCSQTNTSFEFNSDFWMSIARWVHEREHKSRV